MSPSAKPKVKTTGSKKDSADCMPKSVRDFVDSVIESAGKTAGRNSLWQAQEIIWAAGDIFDKRVRITLAQKALQISPLCADAYSLLGQEAFMPEVKRDYYAKGVEAGEKAIGSKKFRELEGSFWRFHETRPYMRARAGLAETLWKLGDIDGAIGHYKALLKLNPGDNQGIRYVLSSCYLNSGKDVELKKLLASYEASGSALWLYTQALVAFREGDKNAPKIAEAAWKSNKHVSAMLAKTKRLTPSKDGCVTVGGSDEATAYVEDNGDAWQKTPKAIEWLIQTTKGLSLAKTEKRG